MGLVTAVILLLAAPLQAADAPAARAPVAGDPRPPTPPSADPWQFQLTFYGWLSAIDGDVGVRRLPSVPVHASFVDLLTHLDGILPVAFLAKNGDWSLLFDFYWANLGTDSTLPGPAQLSVGLRQTIASVAVGYRLPIGGADFDLSATAGFRYQRLSVDATLASLAPPLALAGSDVAGWLDPVFGLSLQYRIDEKWFINALADVGGFGLGSKLTSQGFVALGYNWTRDWSTAVGYRALYTDYQAVTGPASNFRYVTTIHGPFVSLAYHF